MPLGSRPSVRLLLVCLLCLTALSVVPAPATAAGEAGEEAGECLGRSAEDRPPAQVQATVTRTGDRRVRVEYDTSDAPAAFAVAPPDSVTVTNESGFRDSRTAGAYRYDGGDAATLEYRIDRGDRWRNVSGEGWLLAPTPRHLRARVAMTARPAGVVGDRFAFLGDYQEFTYTDGCHDVSLVVAESASPAAPRAQLYEALRDAAQRYDVGHRYESVRIFAVPGLVEPGYHGRTRRSEAWVATTVPAGTPAQQLRLLVHEYLHTRHSFGGTSAGEMEWFTEGVTDYQAARLLREGGFVSNRSYNRFLRTGANQRVELLDRSTWPYADVVYTRGASHAAVVDYRIRAASDGEHTLEDVVRRLNANRSTGRRAPIRLSVVLGTVEAVSNETTAEWTNSSLRTSEPFPFEPAAAPEPPRGERRAAVPVGHARLGALGPLAIPLLEGSLLAVLGLVLYREFGRGADGV